MKKRFNLLLIGGLGNQLFQIAAAEFIANGQGISVYKLNNKRDIIGESDIEKFVLPVNLKFKKNLLPTKFVGKIYGYLARMKVHPRNYEKLQFIKYFITKIGQAVSLIYFKSIVEVYVPDNLGFTRLEISKNKNVAILGYFQSFKWHNSSFVTQFLNKLTLKNCGSLIKHLIDEANKEKPIILHIRRGDYKVASGFGLLSARYYLNAISKMESILNFKNIWVFSDEINLVRNLISFDEKKYDIRWFGNLELTDYETLELMRYGSGYIIANSTFSWWAAYLAYNKSAPVIAPNKWFQQGEDPNELCPPDWIKMESFWE